MFFNNSLLQFKQKTITMKRILLFVLLGIGLFSCEEDDLCVGVVCENGGLCADGLCDCPPQWTGATCSEEVPPDKMIVGRIRLTEFPLTDSGGLPWDPIDGPDVYIVIKKGNVKLFQTDPVEDLTTVNEWTVDFEFPNPTGDYLFEVYDDDQGLTPDDLIGQVFAPIYKYGFGFPSSFFINCAGCVVEMELKEVVYEH